MTLFPRAFSIGVVLHSGGNKAVTPRYCQPAATISEAEGDVGPASTADAAGVRLADEVAPRAFNSGTKVLAVRNSDIPGGKSLSAVLRQGICRLLPTE